MHSAIPDRSRIGGALRALGVRAATPLRIAVFATLAIVAVAAPRPVTAQSPAATTSIPAPNDSLARSVGVLRPGDVLEIIVYRDKELSNKYLIDSRGFVQIPGLGVVQAAGLDPTQVKARLVDSLRARGFERPELSVQPLVRVSVLGEVRAPNLFPVDPGTSLLQLLTLAGGPTPNADLRKARVIRDGRAFTVDLESALGGGAAGRIVLYSNDYLIVPKKTGFTRENLGLVLSGVGVLLTIVNVAVSLRR